MELPVLETLGSIARAQDASIEVNIDLRLEQDLLPGLVWGIIGNIRHPDERLEVEEHDSGEDRWFAASMAASHIHWSIVHQ